MIKKLNNSNVSISSKIYAIFQLSYKVEARLLNVTQFPPLQRTSEEILKSNNEFYGFYLAKNIVGVIEIHLDGNQSIHIQSLVVHPIYFRKGIGKKLIRFVIDHYHSKIFTVETGVKNDPAINLYRSFNFIEEIEWDTDHAVRKVRFRLFTN